MNLKDFENILWGYCEIDEEIYGAMAPFLGDITDERKLQDKSGKKLEILCFIQKMIIKIM